MPEQKKVETTAVSRALQVIEKGFSVRNSQNGKIKAIQDLFRESFIVSDTKGTRKLNAQRLYQAMWRTAGRTKPLDFMINGVDKEGMPVDPNVERVVTDGVATVMKRGGFNAAFRDKQGLAFNFLMYGDAFLHIGTNDDKKSSIPIKFRVPSNDNIYVDNFATGIRSAASGASASQLVIVYTYEKELFDVLWPGNESVEGALPRNKNEKEQIKDTNQFLKDEHKVEVAFSYNLTTREYVVFAGNASTELQLEEGDAYPFIKDNEPYIPVLQFICMPASEGFYNEGIGSMVYKLAILQRELLNMEVNHITDNTYPITHVNIPKGQVAKYFKRLKQAHQMRANGKKGFVPMEYDPNSPNTERVSAESLLTENLFNEWQAVFDRLDQELRRLGINIDELDVTDQDKTATEVLALEESSNAFVKQIMEYNASESQVAVEITMDMITEFVGKKDKTPLNLTTNISSSVVESRVRQVNLGMVSEELKRNHYWADVNARSGALPSNNILRAEINALLPFMQPGSQAWRKAVGQLSQINNFEASPDEFLLTPEGPAQSPEGVEAPASQTDRKTINIRAQQQAPVI